jgi:hypothetical protein
MDTTEIIRQMMSNLVDGEVVAAQANFEDALSAKTAAALDNRKYDIATTMFNQADDEE